MSATTERPRPRESHLLALLPPDDQQQLRAGAQFVRLRRGQILHRPGEPIGQVFFPLNGLCSTVSVLEDGSTVEVDTVGRDGIVGLSLYFGAPDTPFQVFAQIPGEALRLPGSALLEAVERSSRLDGLLRRYAQARFTQTAQSVACNRLHGVEQRCARWLLLTHDRLVVDRFQLTQEFLSQILGIRRASATVAARALQTAGAIRYVYGVITIVDRARLESISCECYRLIAGEFERLLSFPRRV
jgi:CRP-like cAMP-binding protein